MKESDVRLEWFLWDNRSRAHIARHAVAPEEVEEMLDGAHRFRRVRNGRYALYGRSAAGRYLVAFFDYLGEGRAYVATAREMDEKEKGIYRRLL
jgi:uncharacterized protein